jgi:hypothetical protein
LILPLNAAGFIASLLKCEFQGAPLLVDLALAPLQSIECGLNPNRPQSFQNLSSNFLIHSCAGERNARAHRLPTSISIASIARQRPMLLAVYISDLQRSSTTAAAQ